MPDRSCVIHFAESQASITAGERSARVWLVEASCPLKETKLP
jgi:hypothetical protein